jgi:hypothetical protein
MIDSVWIRDFRGIHTAHVTGLRSINVLVGPNNSGKTAFLEALYLGCGVGGDNAHRASHSLSAHGVDLPSTDFVDEHPLALIRRKHLHSPSRTTLLRFEPWSGTSPGRFRVDTKSTLLRHPTLHLTQLVRPMGEDWPASRLQLMTWCRFGSSVIPVFSETQLPEMVQAIRQAQEAGTQHNAVFCWDRALTYHYVGTAAWGMSGALPTAKHTFFYDGQQTLAHIPTDFYTNMISVVPGWSQKIAERVGRVLGITEPFNVLFMPTGPDKEWMQGQIAFADRPALPIDDFGDGARAVFKVLAPLIALAELVTEEEPGIFLWEEPELFQNPLTLGRLLAEVADLAQSRSLQVFMATHSLEVVAHLVQQVQAGTLKEEALCTLRTQLHKGDFAAHSFSTDDIRTWTRMQRDLRVPDGFTGSPLHFSIEGPAGSEAASDDGDGDE